MHRMGFRVFAVRATSSLLPMRLFTTAHLHARKPPILSKWVPDGVHKRRRFSPFRYFPFSWRLHPSQYTILCCVGAVGAGCVLLLAPPPEMVPPFAMHLRVTIEGFLRVLRCTMIGAIIVADYKWSLWDTNDQAEWDKCHLRAAKRLTLLAERNGGFYIKVGQCLCSMNHILPTAYTRTFASLQDRVEGRPLREVEIVISRDYLAHNVCGVHDRLRSKDIASKRDILSEIFSFFEERPIAAASVAQVHRARLRGSDEEVAVKVQYLDVSERFRGDFNTINVMFMVTGALFPGYDFSAIMQRTRTTLKAELDFVNEAQNATRAERDLVAEFGSSVTVPSVKWELTTPRVLVTSFVHGVKVTDLDGIARLGISPRWVMQKYIAAVSYMMFRTGFMHSDPHPGNVFAARNPKTGRPQLVFLDHGLYTHLSPSSRRFLADIWTAIVDRDDSRVEALAAQIGCGDDWEILATCFLQFPYKSYSPFKLTATPKDMENIRRVAHQQMTAVCRVTEHLPQEYAFVLRNLTTVRATNKVAGNPCCRAAIMYQYSVRTTEEERLAARHAARVHSAATTNSRDEDHEHQRGRWHQWINRTAISTVWGVEDFFLWASAQAYIQLRITFLNITEAWFSLVMWVLKLQKPQLYKEVDELMAMG